MTHAELKKLYQSYGIRGTLFSPVKYLFFDGEFYLPELPEVKSANNWAAKELAWYNYSPLVGDCDNYAFMWYGRMLEWHLKGSHKNVSWAVSPCWGNFNNENHMWGVSATKQGLFHFNYGRLVEPNFKIKGMIGA